MAHATRWCPATSSGACGLRRSSSTTRPPLDRLGYAYRTDRATWQRWLREVSQHQVGFLARTFAELDLDPSVVALAHDVPLEARGGFLALRAPDAGSLFEGLLERGVRTDYRSTILRFGPAPYLTDEQLEQAMTTLGEVVRAR